MTEKKHAKEVFIFGVLLLFSLVLMGLDYFHYLNWLKKPVEKLGAPILAKLHRQKVLLKANLQDQLEAQKQRENELELEIADLKVKIDSIEQENLGMRKLLGAPLPASFKFLAAQVLGLQNGTLTIDQGLENEVRENQTVVWENVLLGKVIKVNPHFSKIQLIYHQNSEIKAKVANTQIRGIVKAQAENVLILDQVLQKENLQKDQLVLSSGEDGDYPPNLLIGKIETIEKKEVEIYQQAILKPFLDYQTLQTVFIITNY